MRIASSINKSMVEIEMAIIVLICLRQSLFFNLYCSCHDIALKYFVDKQEQKIESRNRA
jgi:hypothetical protein